MELNYKRCPEDETKVLSAEFPAGVLGESVTLGIAEIVAALQMKGCIYATTLAIKSGVEDDFVSRTALGLSEQMGDDIHALCPVIGILCECFALMTGGKPVLGKDGQVNIYPAKDCPPLLRGYFDGREQGWDRQDEGEGR